MQFERFPRLQPQLLSAGRDDATVVAAPRRGKRFCERGSRLKLSPPVVEGMDVYNKDGTFEAASQRQLHSKGTVV